MDILTISLTIAFGMIVACLGIHLYRTPWDATALWEQHANRLRKQGIVAQRPVDWDTTIQRRRDLHILSILVFVACLAGVLISTFYH